MDRSGKVEARIPTTSASIVGARVGKGEGGSGEVLLRTGGRGD